MIEFQYIYFYICVYFLSDETLYKPTGSLKREYRDLFTLDHIYQFFMVLKIILSRNDNH